MKIDQDLRDQIREDPDRTARVILSCRASANVSEADLAQCGFKFEQRQTAADECFIHGEIKLKEIGKLSSISGIEAVSSAPEMTIS